MRPPTLLPLPVANDVEAITGREMISVHIKPAARTQPAPAPRVLAIFSFRYDAQLVPDLISNIAPMVDGWVSFDDRASTALFSDEPARRRELLVAARAAGAEWVLAADPDERFESALASAMPSLTAATGPVAYAFALREMYDADHYRVDGVWGRKSQVRLFRMPDVIAPAAAPLHSPWQAMIPDVEVRDSAFAIYHLKMIAAARRRARADLYTHLDPDRRFQPIGYEYLADERGAIFEKIADGRGYHPPHRDDGGLWMPAVGAADPQLPTPRTR